MADYHALFDRPRGGPVKRESIKVLARLVDTHRRDPDRWSCVSVIPDFVNDYERIAASGSGETRERAVIDFKIKVAQACDVDYKIVQIRFV
jgi:hypothetical protein